MRFLIILLLATAPVFAGDDESQDSPNKGTEPPAWTKGLHHGQIGDTIQFAHEIWDDTYRSVRLTIAASFTVPVIAAEIVFGALSFESLLSHGISQTALTMLSFPVKRESKVDLRSLAQKTDPISVGRNRGLIASSIATACHTVLFHFSGLF